MLQTGCQLRQPPGCEIYRHSDGSLSVYKVDGSAEDFTTIEYCTNLLLLAELFIAHDSLSVCALAPTSSLQFYVLTQHSDDKECFIGFFVKVCVVLLHKSVGCKFFIVDVTEALLVVFVLLSSYVYTLDFLIIRSIFYSVMLC